MSAPHLIGFSPSVYVRVARLVALEKGVALRREELDPFQAGGPPAALLALNPFGKVPVLRHGDLVLYETQAIAAYLDEAFAGPALQPAAPAARARLRQLQGIVDAYAYRPLVWGLYVAARERPDEPRAEALAQGRRALAALEALADAPWLLGADLSLADCHLAPVIGYLLQAAEGPGLLGETPILAAWWERASRRPGWGEILG